MARSSEFVQLHPLELVAVQLCLDLFDAILPVLELLTSPRNRFILCEKIFESLRRVRRPNLELLKQVALKAVHKCFNEIVHDDQRNIVDNPLPRLLSTLLGGIEGAARTDLVRNLKVTPDVGH